LPAIRRGPARPGCPSGGFKGADGQDVCGGEDRRGASPVGLVEQDDGSSNALCVRVLRGVDDLNLDTRDRSHSPGEPVTRSHTPIRSSRCRRSRSLRTSYTPSYSCERGSQTRLTVDGRHTPLHLAFSCFLLNPEQSGAAAAAIVVAQAAGDEPTAGPATTRQKIHEKAAWMLHSFLE
jgi:hypothetical protein